MHLKASGTILKEVIKSDAAFIAIILKNLNTHVFLIEPCRTTEHMKLRLRTNKQGSE